MKTQVCVPTRKGFKQILSETVESLLERWVPQIIRRANQKEYLTTAEFKELTGCSYPVQHYLRSEKKISYSQEGRKIFYRTEDVEKFMEERRISSK